MTVNKDLLKMKAKCFIQERQEMSEIHKGVYEV